MLHDRERAAIDGLWTVKISQDARDLPQAQRCRNLEPDSAEFICALAAGLRRHRLLEIGGSSGLSTIALAAAARQTERPPGLDRDRAGAAGGIAAHAWPISDSPITSTTCWPMPATSSIATPTLQFVLIDCEKDDYVRFFDWLRLAPGRGRRRRQHPVARPPGLRPARPRLPGVIDHAANRQGPRSEPVGRAARATV